MNAQPEILLNQVARRCSKGVKNRFSWDTKKLNTLRKLSKTSSQKQASEIIGCSVRTVAQKAKEIGVSFRKFGEKWHSSKHSNEDVELVIALDESGMKRCLIAEKMEIPPSTVSSICNFNHRING